MTNWRADGSRISCSPCLLGPDRLSAGHRHNCSSARNGHRCTLLRALMTISRSAVGVRGGELAGPVGFGVEEGFSAAGEGVAELGEHFYELFDPLFGRLGCSSRFSAVSGGELLCRVEITEAACEGQLSVTLAELRNSSSITSHIRTISVITSGSSLVVSDMSAPCSIQSRMNGSNAVARSRAPAHHSSCGTGPG